MRVNDRTLHPSHNVQKVNNIIDQTTPCNTVLAYTVQQAVKGPKMTSVKQFKQKNQQSLSIRNMKTLMNHINKRQPLNNRLLT